MIDDRRLDTLLRQVGEELDRLSADHGSADPKPTLRQHHGPARSGRVWATVAASAAALAGLIGVIVVTPFGRAEAPSSPAPVTPAPGSIPGSTGRTDHTSPASNAASADTSTPLAQLTLTSFPFEDDSDHPAPTVLAPSSLPDGFELTHGGSITWNNSARITVFNVDRTQWAWIGIGPDGPRACEVVEPSGSTVTTRTLTGRDDAISEFRLAHPNPLPNQRLQLRWCDDITGRAAYLEGEGIPLDTFTTLASTLDIPADPQVVSFGVPDGFTVSSGLIHPKASRLIYTAGDRTLDILTFTPAAHQLELERINQMPGLDVDINGTPGVDLGERGLGFQYDDHTFVYLTGTNLTADERLTLSRSLQPTDPNLAPPVTDNCDALGLCG